MLRSFTAKQMARTCVLALAAGGASTVQAAPIAVDPQIFYTNWINVRSNASRFDPTPNSYSELTVGVYPSPDSDLVFTGIGAPQSSNGSASVVSASHPFITNGSYVPLDHVGPTTSAYSWGTYVAYHDPISSIDAGDVEAFSAPWDVRVANPNGPTVQLAMGSSLSLNPGATPDLVTDMRISGDGLNPTLTWKNNGSSDSVTVVLFRVIDDENEVIRQVHSEQLAAPQNTFTIPSEFSGTPTLEGVEADSALTFGEQYVVLVANQARDADGNLEGVARSFFEFTAVEDNGNGDAAIYLPTVTNDPETGDKVFTFDIEVTAEEQILIDPEVAVGYTYETGTTDPNFATVRLPVLPGADNYYDLVLFDDDGKAFDTLINIIAGEIFDFRTRLIGFGIGSEGISKFRILGIETSALVDPSDAQGFVTGLSFVADGRFTGTQTPITGFVVIPEPPVWALLMLGFLALRSYRSDPSGL